MTTQPTPAAMRAAISHPGRQAPHRPGGQQMIFRQSPNLRVVRGTPVQPRETLIDWIAVAIIALSLAALFAL
jgi:hypothetical protein